MKRFITTVLAFVMIITLGACGQSAAVTWQEQYDLGVKYLSEGNYEEAIIAFNAAIEIDPKQAVIYSGRGQAYILSGETPENLAAALADFEQAVSMDETLAEGWTGMAEVYISMGDYDKAAEILKQALDKTEENPSVGELLEEVEENVKEDAPKAQRIDKVQPDGVLISSVVNRYDDNGRLVKEDHYNYSGSSNLEFSMRYVYDDKGNVAREEFYDANDVLGWYWLNTYNDEGMLILDENYTADAVLQWYYTYTYDEENVLQSKEYWFPGGGISTRDTYEYDDRGNLILQESIDLGEEGFWGDWRYVYSYDENGFLINQKYYSGSSDELIWDITYVNNAQGVLVKEEWRTQTGNQNVDYLYSY